LRGAPRVCCHKNRYSNDFAQPFLSCGQPAANVRHADSVRGHSRHQGHEMKIFQRIGLPLLAVLLLAHPAMSQEPIKVVGKAFCLFKHAITVPDVAGSEPRLKIMSVLAKVGDRVEKDARLAGYEPLLETLIAEKSQLSRHTLSGLEAQLQAATLAFEREKIRRDEMREMTKKGLFAESDLLMIDRSIDIFEKRLDFLREVIAAEKARMDTREFTAVRKRGVDTEGGEIPKEFFITSPIAGHVLSVNPRAMPGAVFTLDEKAPLFEIGVLEKMTVRCAVHEIQAVKLKAGDEARMVFYAFPDKVYTSRIARLSQVTMTVFLQQPTFYEVEIALDNPDLAIKDGMRCDVTLIPSAP